VFALHCTLMNPKVHKKKKGFTEIDNWFFAAVRTHERKLDVLAELLSEIALKLDVLEKVRSAGYDCVSLPAGNKVTISLDDLVPCSEQAVANSNMGACIDLDSLCFQLAEIDVHETIRAHYSDGDDDLKCVGCWEILPCCSCNSKHISVTVDAASDYSSLPHCEDEVTGEMGAHDNLKLDIVDMGTYISNSFIVAELEIACKLNTLSAGSHESVIFNAVCDSEPSEPSDIGYNEGVESSVWGSSDDEQDKKLAEHADSFNEQVCCNACPAAGDVDDDNATDQYSDNEEELQDERAVWSDRLQKHCEYSMQLLKDPKMCWSEEEKETILNLIERGILLQKLPQSKLYKWARRNCCNKFDHVMGKLVRNKLSQG